MLETQMLPRIKKGIRGRSGGGGKQQYRGISQAISGEFRVYKRIKRVKFECEKPGKKSADIRHEDGRG